MTQVVTDGFGAIIFQAPLAFVPAGGAIAGWLLAIVVVVTLATMHAARSATAVATADALTYN